MKQGYLHIHNFWKDELETGNIGGGGGEEDEETGIIGRLEEQG